MDKLCINLFGELIVAHDPAAEPLRLPRSLQAFFAYLLLQHHLVSRDLLMDVFWANRPAEQARSSLTTAIWRLRLLLESDRVRPGTFLITKNSGEVGFNWQSSYWLDTEAFEQAAVPLLRVPPSLLGEVEMAKMREAVALYRGELLEGLDQEWALADSERFRSLYLSCLARLMYFHRGRSEFDQAIAHAQEILRCDPLREEIHRDLMRMYLESGQRTQAIRQFIQCRDLLMQELAVPPLEETQALYQQIISSTHQLSVDESSSNPAAKSAPESGMALLATELQFVKRSLEQTARTLAQLAGEVNRLSEESSATLSPQNTFKSKRRSRPGSP